MNILKSMTDFCVVEFGVKSNLNTTLNKKSKVWMLLLMMKILIILLSLSDLRKKEDPIIAIRKLIPIQMPNINLDDLKKGRKAFTKEEWIDVMLRSVGMEEAIEKSL